MLHTVPRTATKMSASNTSSSSTPLWDLEGPLRRILSPDASPLLFAIAVVLFYVTISSITQPSRRINKQYPLVNPPPLFDIGGVRARRNFRLKGWEILEESATKYGDKPFRILTDSSDTTVLPPKHAEELRAAGDRLSSTGPRRRVRAIVDEFRDSCAG